MSFTIENSTIIFDKEFNQLLEPHVCSNIMHSINAVIFHPETRFNYPIDFLPDTIIMIKTSEYFKNAFIFSKNLEEVYLGNNFNKPIQLSKKLLKLVLGNLFNQHIVIPKNLITLEFGDKFNSSIELTKSIKTIVFRTMFNQIIKISKNIRSLEFGQWFNQPIKSSKTLLILKIGAYCHCQISLPKKLKQLFIGAYLPYNISFPKHLKSLGLGLTKIHRVILNESLEYLDVWANDDSSCFMVSDNLSNSLKEIYSITLKRNEICTNLSSSITRAEFMV